MGEVNAAMEEKYHDMYALFRHMHGAEEYFDALPSHVQDHIRPHFLSVDSYDRLLDMAEDCRKGYL